MKPLVEQMIFFTPSVDLIVNCMKITLIKKKIKMDKFVSPFFTMYIIKVSL